MKKLILCFAVAALGLLMFGCSALDNPVAPSHEAIGSAPIKGSTIQFQYSETLGFIFYPAGQVTKGNVSDVEFVTVKDGGKLKADFEYTSTDGKKTHARAELSVPKGAVSNDVVITMTLDTVVLGIKFQPEGLVFSTPAKLDFHVDHVNQIPNDPPVGFYYVDDGGNFSPISYEDLDNHVHPDHSDLNLNNAYIPHFSIYAFGR